MRRTEAADVADTKPTSPESKRFDGVKVFSATMVAVREKLGDTVSEWILQRPALDITDIVVTQSSDARFHCISISVFYREAHGGSISATSPVG